MKKGGFSYNFSASELKEYMKLPIKENFRWLRDANNMCRRLLKGKSLRIWNNIRDEKI